MSSGDGSDRSGRDGGHHHRSDRATAVRKVPGHRISTAETADRPVQETLSVILEAPTTIDVQGVGTYTLLCTPGDNRALAVGFLLTEGIVDSLDEVGILRECEDDPSTIRVTLVDSDRLSGDAGRNLLIVSSCGLCGIEALDEKLRTLPRVGDALHLDRHTLWLVGRRLGDHQPLFRTCGGAHAAGIFTASGEIIASAEDAGRHNALDKAIGRCLMMGRSTAGCGAVLSGRVSLEMVSKCARAGIELISAISAPTSLAIEVAERCGITLCVFVREERATVLTHAGRITTRPAAGEDPGPE